MNPDELAAAALTWLGVREGTESPDAAVSVPVAASVIAFLDHHPGTDWVAAEWDDQNRTWIGTAGVWDGTGGRVWAPTTRQGATMLAARLIRRRNSAGGVEAITDVGIAYTARTDPDVALLLNMGKHARPKVG